MFVKISMLSNSVHVWATLLTRLAERYPDATIKIDDQHHLRLIDDQREWDMKDDKTLFVQLMAEDVITNWVAVPNTPYPGRAEG
jgi:hypothetical protein